MSVYTTVTKNDLTRFLSNYDAGELVSFEGISEGIENTNYFVDTDRAEYVLTIFEQCSAAELPYFLDFMAHISEAGTPCPHPVADRQGKYLTVLANKPATLLTRLDGRTISEPNFVHCEQVGITLATLHQASTSFTQRRASKRDIEWCREQSKRLKSQIDVSDYHLLKSEITHQSECDLSHLPCGTIHADLFCDNVLFNGSRLTGIIDFYYAYYGSLLYDLAITVNAWCRNADGTIDQVRYKTLLSGYSKHRPTTQEERDAWQDVMRKAALRFWVSRLCDKLFPRQGEITHTKDPDTFRDILLDCRLQVPRL